VSDTLPPAFCTQAEFARLMGVSKPAVTQWKAAGRLVLVDGRVDVEATRAVLARFRREGDPLNPGPKPVLEGWEPKDDEEAERIAALVILATGSEWTTEEAIRVKESHLALLKRLEYDQKSGAVVAVAEVAAAVGAQFSQVRQRLLAIPAEQAEAIARCRTVPEVRDLLESLIVEVLQALSRGDGAPDAP
jgi:DNA-binding transcriptional regulator YdaS (Cro superfamily)